MRKEQPFDPSILEQVHGTAMPDEQEGSGNKSPEGCWRSNCGERQDERQNGSKTASTPQKATNDLWRSVFTEKTYRGIEKSEGLRDKIVGLAVAIHELYPKVETRNPYARLLEKHLPYGEAYLQVIHLVVHSITSLHHRFRYCHRGIYLSEREDVLSALALLEEDLEELLALQRSARWSYGRLYQIYGTGTFTRKEASTSTGYSKTHMQRLLNHLVGMKLVDREGYPNRGYRYWLRELPRQPAGHGHHA